MSLQLNTIKKSQGAKQKKRLGRGNSSGKGTYCGKGIKGQKARSGVSGLKRLGMKQVLLRLPKYKGFKSLQGKAQIVNLSVINSHFKDNEIVSPHSLFKRKLIDTPKRRVKILGSGKLTLNGVKFEGVEMSESVKNGLKQKRKSK